MTEIVRALSIMQPWGFLVASGQKDIENRTWRTTYRGRFLIHVGKNIDADFNPADFAGLNPVLPDQLDVGGIIGEAEIVACIESSGSPWFFGPFGFVIRNAKLLPFRPCNGARGFFDPDSVRPKGAPKPPKPISPQGVLL